MGRKRSRSRSREPPAQPSTRRRLPSPAGRSPPEPKETRVAGKIGFIAAARRTGRLRGQAVRRPPVIPRPGTPPPPSEKRAAFRASPSPEPAEEEHAAAATSPADRRRDREKALYLVMQEQCHGHGVVSVYYAVHRVGLAPSQHGISVSVEELEDPPVARFKAAPGMSFFKVGSGKIVGVTGKGAAGAVEAESVVIHVGTWEVSAGPPPSSAECGLVEVSGRIFAAAVDAEDPRCEVVRSASAGWSWSPLPRPPFRDRIIKLAAYTPCRGLLVATDKGETYLLDRQRRRGRGRPAWDWEVLHGAAPPPFGERAVYAKGHDRWYEVSVSPADGRLRAHDLNIVPGAGTGAPPRLVHATHRVSDPIPVITPSTPTARGKKLVYLGRGKFCAVQVGAAERGDARAGGCRVTVTVFRVVDAGAPAPDEERRRRLRPRGMSEGWIAALERAIADMAAASGRRKRKLCRVNLWSRTYIARGGAGHGSSLAGVLWM